MIRALLLAAAPAAAQTTDVSRIIAVDVLAGWHGADGVQVAGLRVRLAPGWKTYWRSAGAAGISPQMDWRGSGNLRRVTPEWPVPTVWGRDGARSLGYDRDFVLPLLVPVAGPGPVRLRGMLDIGVCEDICLPARVRVAADLPAGGPVDPAVKAALDRRPTRVAAPATCALRPVQGGLDLAGEIVLPPLGRGEAVVFELPDPSVWITDSAVTRAGGRLRAVAQLIGAEGRPVSVDRAQVRITVIGPDCGLHRLRAAIRSGGGRIAGGGVSRSRPAAAAGRAKLTQFRDLGLKTAACRSTLRITGWEGDHGSDSRSDRTPGGQGARRALWPPRRAGATARRNSGSRPRRASPPLGGSQTAASLPSHWRMDSGGVARHSGISVTDGLAGAVPLRHDAARRSRGPATAAFFGLTWRSDSIRASSGSSTSLAALGSANQRRLRSAFSFQSSFSRSTTIG